MDIVVFPSHWALAAAGLALIFGFSNGFRDSSTIVASVVSTRVLTPTVAFGLCALFEFFGASFIGSRIAKTVMATVVGVGAPSAEEVARVLATGLCGAVLWGLVSWWRAWPTSNTQALLGALTGASWMTWGAHHLVDGKKLAVVAVLILSPTLGFLLSVLVTSLFRYLGGWMATSAKPLAQGLHVLGCLSVAAAHGSNDGQLIIAMLAMATAASAGSVEPAATPTALRIIVAATIATGVLMGGRRLLHKLGMKFYPIRDMQGVGAQTAAALMMLGCLSSGFPASTTQLISGTIVGAGAAKSIRSVRWAVVGDIVLSWVVTIPATALLGAALTFIIRRV